MLSINRSRFILRRFLKRDFFISHLNLSPALKENWPPQVEYGDVPMPNIQAKVYGLLDISEEWQQENKVGYQEAFRDIVLKPFREDEEINQEVNQYLVAYQQREDWQRWKSGRRGGGVQTEFMEDFALAHDSAVIGL